MPEGYDGVWLAPRCPFCNEHIRVWAAKRTADSAEYDIFEFQPKCHCNLSKAVKEIIQNSVITAVEQMARMRKEKAEAESKNWYPWTIGTVLDEAWIRDDEMEEHRQRPVKIVYVGDDDREFDIVGISCGRDGLIIEIADYER